MKVSFVVPRYGPPSEVTGGAENAIRMFAEQLAATPDWAANVLTTTARDSGDWEAHYPEGATEIAGVGVHRYPLARPRTAAFHDLLQRIIRHPEAASPADQARFADEVGPFSPALIDALGDNPSDLVVFSPYLFYPTIRGVAVVRARAVVQPAAHDEPIIRIPLFRDVFTAAAGLVFYTPSEQRLASGLFSVDAVPQTIVGIGVEEGRGNPDEFRSAAGLAGDDPYLVYVGRLDPSKGTTSLARFFAAYKSLHPGPLKLVLIGQVAERPEPHDDIVVFGPGDEAAKWGALAGATALVAPSYYESFSLLLMEGWTAGLPALVNARCPVTAGHVNRARGGLLFDGFGSFAVAVDRLLADPPVAQSLGAAGRRYVDRHFRWPTVIDRYRRFLELVANRRA